MSWSSRRATPGTIPIPRPGTRSSASPRRRSPYPAIRLSLPRFRTVARYLDAFQPDLLHVATEGSIGLTGRRYAVRRAVPLVTSYHANFPQYARHYGAGLLEPLMWRWLRWFHGPASGPLSCSPGRGGGPTPRRPDALGASPRLPGPRTVGDAVRQRRHLRAAVGYRDLRPRRPGSHGLRARRHRRRRRRLSREHRRQRDGPARRTARCRRVRCGNRGACPVHRGWRRELGAAARDVATRRDVVPENLTLLDQYAAAAEVIQRGAAPCAA